MLGLIMKICVLTSLPTEDFNPSHHFQGSDFKLVHVQEGNIEQQIQALKDQHVDVFVNLCDGTPDEAISGIELVKILEKLNVVFTGADSSFFDPTREEMKMAAVKAGIPVPASMFVSSEADLDQAAAKLRFPLIVKPPHGYASMGIRRESRVADSQNLKLQARKTMESNGGRALIEEFIEGREFTCLVLENPDNPKHPITFKPVEFRFPQGESFKHYEMKWVDYKEMRVLVVDNPEYEQCLRDYTARLFLEMKGNGYARCDYRLGADGKFYMLEINPNCGIFYPPGEYSSADISLIHDSMGHQAFLDLLIQAAKKRRANISLEGIN